MMNDTLISYQNVEISSAKNSILNAVNFKQHKSEFVHIIGQVGSGKSLFLKTLYCDFPIKSGIASIFNYDLIKIKKKNIPLIRRNIGLISQDFQLLPNYSVYNNLKFILKMTGWGKNVITTRIIEVLSTVKMENKVRSMPYELSEGERQKVIIARALLNFPSIIIADEPTRNLDDESSYKIVKLLYNISLETQTAVIMTTHNNTLIKKFSGKIKKCENKQLVNYEIKNLEL